MTTASRLQPESRRPWLDSEATNALKPSRDTLSDTMESFARMTEHQAVCLCRAWHFTASPCCINLAHLVSLSTSYTSTRSTPEQTSYKALHFVLIRIYCASIRSSLHIILTRALSICLFSIQSEFVRSIGRPVQEYRRNATSTIENGNPPRHLSIGPHAKSWPNFLADLASFIPIGGEEPLSIGYVFTKCPQMIKRTNCF